MAEGRDTRREAREVRLAPLRPPRADDITGSETRHENRRLKEKSEHGLHPVILPRFLIARMEGDIMI
jgi:hypothetical protein